MPDDVVAGIDMRDLDHAGVEVEVRGEEVFEFLRVGEECAVDDRGGRIVQLPIRS